MTIKSDDEADWKIVGSRSRRESFSVGRVFDGATASHHNNYATTTTTHLLSQAPSSLINQPQPEFKRRGSACSEKQWDSFGGFQWEGPSMFDQDSNSHHATSTPLLPPPPHTPSEQYFDPHAILSTPMLPNVSVEPIYRQQRSYSFSMGQDPALFGYDDYAGTRNALLAPTMEEEEENDTFADDDDAYLRSRSQSSNAAFGMYPSGHWMHNTHRRGSLGSFMDSTSSNKKDILLLPPQRRMSQPLNHIQEYSFPEIIPNGGPTHSSSSGIISTSSGGSTSSPTPFLSASSTSSIQPLSDYLDSHRPSNTSSILPSPLQIMPEASISATVMPSHHYHQQQQDITTSSGKGLSLQRLPPHIPLFMVEFKSGRTDFYYVSDPSLQIQVGDLVLVEADRGKDLGKVATDVLTVEQVLLLQQQQKHNSSSNRLIIDAEDKTVADDTKKNATSDSFVKKIYRKAASEEISLLLNKEQDEQRALAVCLQKIKNRKLSMEVVDAEFQWDRRKLTFYFIAERRIDFRELVRELFKIYKTRIWMCAVNSNIPTKSVTGSSVSVI